MLGFCVLLARLTTYPPRPVKAFMPTFPIPPADVDDGIATLEGSESSATDMVLRYVIAWSVGVYPITSICALQKARPRGEWGKFSSCIEWL